MGFFNIIAKAVQYATPIVADKIHEKNETLGVSDDSKQLILECHNILSAIEQMPIENNKEILQFFNKLDIRIFKLERINLVIYKISIRKYQAV